MEKLSATEFARLTALLTKGSALTAEEQTEKAALESKILAERASDQDPPAEDEPTSAEDDASEADPAPEADPVEGDVDPASDAFTGLTVGEKFRALITGRASLSKALGQARAALAEAQTTITALTARATAAEADLATAQTSLAEAAARVTTLEAQAKDLNAAVTDELAGLGVARQDLVAGIADGSGDGEVPATEAALESALAGLSSHSEKAALISRYDAAKKARAKAPKTAA